MSKKESVSPYTAHMKPRVKRQNDGISVTVSTDRAARQHSRYASLKAQFNRCARQLVGRTAMIALPGWGCKHSTEQFRPVHWERRWRTRPFFVLLSVGRDDQNQFTLNLVGATSFFDPETQKLRYINGDGQKPCQYDYMRHPTRGAGAPVLDGDADYVLFTAANNLLQELVNTASQPPKQLTLPRLVCLVEGRHIPLDYKKIEALAESIPEELREQYKQRLAKEAEIVSLGTRFGNAAVMPNNAITKAFTEKRAYEDYSELLGAEIANPARKILMAANPAAAVLAQNGLEPGWDETAPQELFEKLFGEMRQMLPLPELILDTDLIDALAEPNKPLKLSRALSDLVEQEPAAVIRALRNSMPPGAALREHITNEELLVAARNPYSPLRVGSYSRIQVVNTEDFNSLPDYATGNFWSIAGWRPQFPVWVGKNGSGTGVDFEPGDIRRDQVECLQLKREKIASE